MMGDPDCLALYDDADFYDREFATRNFDIDFWRRRALHAGGPVLEIACGTGRLTLPIARAGVPITGLDVSAAMLARARSKSAGLPFQWVHADCRDFALPGTYRLIFSAANALQHLHDTASHLAFFRCVRRHLAPDGEFIVDVMNPDVTKLSRKPSVRYWFRDFVGAAGPIRVEAASGYEPATQVLHFELFYLDAGGCLLRTKRVAMRCFFPQELDLLCRHAGWRVVEKLGSYEGEPFGAGAPQQIVVCRAG
jgi:SAM-dependent methyltransferase